MKEEVYRADGLGYSYGGRVALREICFTVRSGESLAVLGANGSGKSTLLKILNGLIFPKTGKVEFMGAPLTEESLSGEFLKCFRERVGFVFPEPDVQLFCPTVYDELAFGPLQLGVPDSEIKKRVDELLEMLGISNLSGRAPYTLSGGEKKKVAIASVLSVDPDVLLLDEPTNGLDPRTQVWFFELLQSLKVINKTFIMCTHDLSLVEDLASRAVVLDESHRVVFDGPALDVLKDKDLLLRANIIHEHTHRHGGITHIHSHGPYSTHDEHD
ncbi:MAG: ABC transporter ATP-binding protein [Deltaproteobacteria bacterium]|nr:ABC transporter ATP-binding protein [Deltaproteobacteria bacterium]